MNQIHNTDKVGHFEYEVEAFQEDVCGRLSWGVLCNLLLRTAGQHATSLGYGYRQMIERHHVWVLARLVVEMDEMPLWEERYSIDTWLERYYRQFTDRYYSVRHACGKPIGRAMAVWSLIDTESRQPADLETIGGEGFRSCIVANRLDLGALARIRMSDCEPSKVLMVSYSDLDINGHANSIRYITHAMDIFPAQYHIEHPLKRLEVAYSAESFAGDTLRFYHTQVEAHVHHVEVRRALLDATEVVVCRLALTHTA